MPRIGLACSLFFLFLLSVASVDRCAGSEQQRLLIRDGKKLICTVQFQSSLSGDCGTESYDAVFSARILALNPVPGSKRQDAAQTEGARDSRNLRLTVEPQEVFKGHLPRVMQLSAEQGECFPDAHIGDDWLFFGRKNAKTNELEISYRSSNLSGPIKQRREYVERLRRLARGDGLSYVTGEVEYPSFDLSKGYLSNPRPNHRLLITTEDGTQSYSVITDARGRFELGPVAPGTFQIDANTDPQFRSIWSWGGVRAISKANGCDFVRIELGVNSEISGRVILPQGYKYKKSEIGNYFPLFHVEVRTLDGKQAHGPFGASIGDGLKFAVRGLEPGNYVVQLVNYAGEEWLKMPVFAPGVTDRSAALQIQLGWAEHRTGLEIRVPPEALKTAQ